MISRLPGWANYIILWHIYFVIAMVLYYAFCFAQIFEPTKEAVLFLWVLSAIHAGAYLAKWRFDHGNWKFW